MDSLLVLYCSAQGLIMRNSWLLYPDSELGMLTARISGNREVLGSSTGYRLTQIRPQSGTERRNTNKKWCKILQRLFRSDEGGTGNFHWQTRCLLQALNCFCAFICNMVCKLRKVFSTGPFAKQWPIAKPNVKYCQVSTEQISFIAIRN